MSRNSKLLVIAFSAAFLIGSAIIWLTPSGSSSYVATSRVMVMPYTNAVFARSFELSVVQRSPGVMRLRSFRAGPAATIPGMSGAGIDIIVRGATSVEAQRLANEAAVTLCATARQLYGGTALVVGMANRARPYSAFHDSILPGVGGLFAR